MEDLDILNIAMETWLTKDPDNRHIFSITGDKKTQTTSCGMGGEATDICSAIVNEMLSDEELAYILTVAVDTFNKMKGDLEKEVNKETLTPEKKYLS
jgi:hypothetical protein